jgi:hypothetical protein
MMSKKDKPLNDKVEPLYSLPSFFPGFGKGIASDQAASKRAYNKEGAQTQDKSRQITGGFSHSLKLVDV